MSGENNPHFSPFADPNPGARRALDPSLEAVYLRENPQVLAMFDEPSAQTLAGMKRFDRAVAGAERVLPPNR